MPQCLLTFPSIATAVFLGVVVSVHSSVAVGVDLQPLRRRRPCLHPRLPGHDVLVVRQLKRLGRVVVYAQAPLIDFENTREKKRRRLQSAQFVW